MMTKATLRRYLAVRYLFTFVAVFALCSLLIFMIDFMEMLRQSGKFGRVEFPTLIMLTLLRLPAYTELLLAFAVLVGAITTLLFLNRSSEIAVMRAAGMSAWQFLLPGIVIAFLLGVLSITVYNPLAAASRAQADEMFAKVFGRHSSFLLSQGAFNWLRQKGPEGPSLMGAAAVSKKGLVLTRVVALQFDPKGNFVARIDAKSARLGKGVWTLNDAWISKYGGRPVRHRVYHLKTHLTAEHAQDALAKAQALSFWELPKVIQGIERSGLSSNVFQVQYQLLWARPILLIAMVLLGATVSLRSFRSGGIQSMIIAGMIGGFGFLLFAEVSRQLGVAGLVSPLVSVWVPIAVSIFVTTTVLLHQEDG